LQEESLTGISTSQDRGSGDGPNAGESAAGSTADTETGSAETPGQRQSFQFWPPRLPYPNPAIDRLRAVTARLTPAALWRDHRLFTVAVCLSIIPRFVATMGFKPALLIQDSFSYMEEGKRFNLGETRPAGYPMLLWLLHPLHSLLVVTTVQHIMGIGLAVIIYGLLRSRRLPAWGATLAAAPTLFDPRQIWLESSILPDTLFTLALMVAVAILVVRPKPRIWQAVLIGLLVCWASVIRGNGAPVFMVILAFLLIRRAGWRVITACVLAFALPLVTYMSFFDIQHNSFNITNSSGLFLWSRTMSFANCAIIKPPKDLLPLCPENQPGYPTTPTPAWSVDAMLNARTPADYLWAPGVWYETDADPGVNAYNNKLATEFAERAILAQPLDYVKVVARDVMLTFLSTDRPTNYLAMYFTVAPHVTTLAPYMRHDLYIYSDKVQNTHVHQPWAYLIFLYQLPVWFPGIVFLAVMVAGLGLLIRRRNSLAALAWSVAAINLLVPIAAHEIDYRYAISAVPFACLALGLALSPSLGRKPREVAQS
jgi:hypothetical protein